MKEPKRLLSGDGTSLERFLLSAAHQERPSADLRRRMRRGIGVAASLFGINAALAAVGQIAVVTLLAVSVGDSVVTPVPPGSTRNAEVPAVVSKVEKPAPPSQVAPPSEPARAANAVVTPPASQRVARNDASSDLREEIRLLDGARAALKQESPRRALAELARYRQRFPRGTFQQEASVLRVEALAQSGQNDRAAALGREFVAKHPDSPHVGRVEEVTSSASPARSTRVEPR